MDDDEPLFMVMMLVHDDGPQGVSVWKAALVEGHGRALTREQAEAIVAAEGPGARFLYRYARDSEHLGPPDGVAPPLTMPPRHTMWDYGEPPHVDMIEALRAVYAAGGSTPPPPDVDNASVEVARVLAIAADWFGVADAHRVETAFDLLVMDLGGDRHGTPPFYGVPLEALGPI
ncbi:MAG TPA: hypothetical protein VGF63_06945 [Solirubrobacteraceae bacterium]|jgi:hypothetical protein